MECGLVAALPRILSIQSHITHGYVGNKAATFPLQILGYHVDPIHTVCLSNHPAYSAQCKGHSLSLDQYENIIHGLNANNLMSYDAVLTGYCKSMDILISIQQTVQSIKTINPKALYFLDPVLGDNGNFYVPHELLGVYENLLLPMANVITPNQFEAEVLSGEKDGIKSLKDVVRVSKIFHGKGVELYFQTGLKLSRDITLKNEALHVLCSFRHKNKESFEPIIFRKTFPCLSRNFFGCGDLFSALVVAFVCRYYEALMRRPTMIADILDAIVSVMTSVLLETDKRQCQELAIIESFPAFATVRDMLMSSSPDFVFNPSEIIPMVGAKAHVVKGPVIGVIFDMDGTLTEPGAIDFKRMHERLGIPFTDDIISSVEKIVDPVMKESALCIIAEEEAIGCERMVLRSGVLEALTAIDSNKIRMAIATRNNKKSIARFTAMLPDELRGVFSHEVSRDCVNNINKPDPRVAWHIMGLWGYLQSSDDSINFASQSDGVDVRALGDVWFVGDSVDDMRCGKSAGCKTCLISTDSNKEIAEDLIDLRVMEIRDFIDIVFHNKNE